MLLQNLMNHRAVLIFPPNWSACVSGPHLALPLIARMLEGLGWGVDTWDLSEDFYGLIGDRIDNKDLLISSSLGDYDGLDQLYFDWEDSILPLAKEYDLNFGLISGFSGGPFSSSGVPELFEAVEKGTVYTDYFYNHLRPRLMELQPSLVGVTIASYNQIMPAVELLISVRKWLPNVTTILGGNVVTRLRDSRPFRKVSALADVTVTFQGESAIRKIHDLIENGRRNGQIQTPIKIVGKNIPPESWPIPTFKGLNLKNYVGQLSLPYVSTRGCYWGKCSFCAIPAGWSESGYAGSLKSDIIVRQIEEIIKQTQVNKFKFVDEAFPPSKISKLYNSLKNNQLEFYWEAYARIERLWEEEEILSMGRKTGLSKLYFGLETVTSKNRKFLGKNDHGNLLKIMENCKKVGISIHLFCMAGHPNTTIYDSMATVDFLIEYQELIDTADFVGFRLDRGTNVEGVMPLNNSNEDILLSLPFLSTIRGGLTQSDIDNLEYDCQERIWDEVPRFLHPLYRLANIHMGNINMNIISNKPKKVELKDSF